LIRAFVAIEVPESIQREMASIQEHLRKTRASVSWVKPGNIHLTLKFLGNIEEGWVDPVLREMVNIAGEMEPFSIEVKGLGCFPNMRNPRVIWIGIEDRDDRATGLQSSLEASLEALGFAREGRQFTPHLTIGRFRTQAGKAELVEEVRRLGSQSLGKIEVTEMILFQSELHPQGAIYTPLGRARFPSGNKAHGRGGHV